MVPRSSTGTSAGSHALPLWPLYEQVAKSEARLFSDSKFLPDSPSGDPPEDILERFYGGDHTSESSLRAFVEKWFMPPGSDLEDVYSDSEASTFRQPCADGDEARGGADGPAFSRDNLVKLMRSLTKRVVLKEGMYSTLVPAPHPFVIPAGRFRESYYWDSYWIIRGLLLSAEDNNELLDLCLGIVRNFAHVINEVGFVPNGFRKYYLNRSQPPMLTCMVRELSVARPDIVAEFLPVLRKELLFWRESERTLVEESTGLVVSRYWSSWTGPRVESLAEDLKTVEGIQEDSERQRLFRDICAAAESGWDFSSRWMDEDNTLRSLRTTRVLPVDLNALLAKSERILSEMAREIGDVETSETFGRMYQEREAALRTLFWDDKRSKWRDVLLEGYRSVGFARRDDDDYASDWVPLWCLDGDLEARRLAVRSLKTSKINQVGGVAASSVNTGQQWDWPNVWPPSQYFLAEGCRMVGDDESKQLGDSIRDRYMTSARRAWGTWRALPEKFDCTKSGEVGGGGEYEVVIGFGWSIGLALCWLRPGTL